MAENARKIVGKVKGPGESPYEFTVVSPDQDRLLRHGEFVSFDITIGDRTVSVLGRVGKRRSLRLLPDPLLKEPDIDPSALAAALGFEGRSELFEITVATLGYYDADLGTLVNPRVLPSVGQPVYLASSEELQAVLSRKKPDETGSAYIGWLLNRAPNDVRVVLDVSELVATHFAIIAGTGAGKSYLASVIVEELMRPYNRGAVVVLDPHGEYEGLLEIQAKPEFNLRGDEQYRPEIHVYKPDDVHVRWSSLEIDDYRHLLPNLTERMEHLLHSALRELKNKSHKPWGFEDLVTTINTLAQGDVGGDKSDFSSTAKSLAWRLDQLKHRARGFHDHYELEVNQLARPGRCTVLRLDELDTKTQQVVAAAVLRKLFDARMRTVHREAAEGDPNYLPTPVFILIEEAHTFAPANDQEGAVSTPVLKRILAEGRKFGVGVGLVSQRPGKLNADVLSQCQTHFLMRIVNPVDQSAVGAAVESAGRELLDELPALSKGQVIVSGRAVRTPLLCQVRPRLSPHGGESPNAPEEWITFHRTASSQQVIRHRGTQSPRRAIDF